MSAAMSADRPKARMSLPLRSLSYRRTSRASGLCWLEPRLDRKRYPKRPESLDLGKQVGYFARGKHDGSRDFAADQPVDRTGFDFAELDFGGSRGHQRGADAGAAEVQFSEVKSS